MNRRQAVYYHNTGKRNLAIKSKIVAETILKENDETSAYVDGFTRLSKRIYSNLEGDTSFCEKESQKLIEVIVSSEYGNGTAVNFRNLRIHES